MGKPLLHEPTRARGEVLRGSAPRGAKQQTAVQPNQGQADQAAVRCAAMIWSAARPVTSAM